jgi:FAD/FMN-containing dehydrogenase
MSDIVSITSDLTRYLSHGALLSDPTELPAYGSDFWGQRGTPGVVVRAAHTQDIVETLRYAAARGIPVIPRAAGTNGSAGFLPTSASILLDLRRLNRVRHIDPELREAIVEPGVLNGDLQAQLAPLGFRYSPDPASAPISTIGGNIAENAGGPRCLKYGVTFHHVHGVECVLANGDMLQLNALDTGPDLLGVIIGSEGTLGVVTQARLKLSPLPQATRTLLASFDQPEKAVTLVSSILATGILPATIEYLDQQAIRLFESYAPTGYPLDAAVLIIDVDGSPEEVEHDIAAIEHIVRVTAREVRRAEDEATSDEPSLPRMTAAMQSVIAARRSNRNIESLSEPRPYPLEEEESSDGIELDAENLTVCVQANVPRCNLRNKLAGAGYHSPALQDIQCDDHMTSVRDMLSEQRYRKAVRDTLLEVDVTLVDNIPARFGSNVVKDVAGYDMKRLFVGSGSIFGVIEKARFQIRNG